MIRAAAEANPAGVTIVVDGLDELKLLHGAEHKALRWIPAPQHVPANLHFVISCSSEPDSVSRFLPKTLVARAIDVGFFPRVQQAQLMYGLLRREGRMLSIEHERSLVTKQDVSSPLFIMAACDEMRAALNRVPYSQLLLEIRNLPHTLAAITDVTLTRLEAIHGAGLIGRVL